MARGGVYDVFGIRGAYKKIKMFDSLKSTLSRNITNARGWRTDRKIVIIESDDWGTIRMPNLEVKKKYEALGYKISNNPYCSYDTLANSEDLEVLFDCLSAFKDQKGSNPVITLNTVMANPCFDKILDSEFKEYFYEPFTDTLKNYYPNENVFELWEQGIENRIIMPQFHGREHVNVPLWLNELQKTNKPLIDAFNLKFWGIPTEIYEPKNLNVQASYDSDDNKNTSFYKKSIMEGLDLFERVFGFRSKTFIANNYIWSSKLDDVLYEQGVIGFQGMKYQKYPFSQNDVKRLKKEAYTGKRNNNSQVYLVRNCVFEPSQYNGSFNNVGKCLQQIEQAFFFKKPAIITSHRLNFIGGLSQENRTCTINQMNLMLETILKRWPDVEFLSSDELTEAIINQN